MNLFVKYIFVVSMVLISFNSWSQPNKINYRDRLGDSLQLVNIAEDPAKVKPPPALKTEYSVGFRLNTDGWGVFFDLGKLIRKENYGRGNLDKFYSMRLFQLEFSEKKHPKELSSSTSIAGINLQPNSYKLGKVSNFYQLKLSYGGRYMIAGKPDPKTVSVHWVYLGGFSAGLVKPYYINISGIGDTKYTSGIRADSFVTPGLILGNSGVMKGINEIEFVPGIAFKTGLHFDFANRRKGKMAVEIGVNGEYYTRPILQMVWQDRKSYFFNLYASVQFGKKK